jgi:pimeloyl-ACP methyl ester carboxylesterase
LALAHLGARLCLQAASRAYKRRSIDMANYVLVHGGWHTGEQLEPVAALIRAEGHRVHTPTIRGNRPGDPKTIGLADAIVSIVEYLETNNAQDIILVGHSYGGRFCQSSRRQV